MRENLDQKSSKYRHLLTQNKFGDMEFVFFARSFKLLRWPYCLFGTKAVSVKKKIGDENGRMLLLKVLNENSELTLIIYYNADTEIEQPKTFINLNNLLSNFTLNENKQFSSVY